MNEKQGKIKVEMKITLTTFRWLYIKYIFKIVCFNYLNLMIDDSVYFHSQNRNT